MAELKLAQVQAAIPRRGVIDIEPGVWQLVEISSRWGRWAEFTAVLEDSFTGSGDLVGHAADSGQTWEEQHPLIAHPLISGGRAVPGAEGALSAAKITVGVHDGLSISFDCNRVDVTDSHPLIRFQATLNLSQYYDLGPYPGSGIWGLYKVGPEGSGPVGAGFFPTADLGEAGVTRLLTMDAGTKLFSLYSGDTLLGTLEDSGTFLTGGTQVGLSFGGGSALDFVDNLRLLQPGGSRLVRGTPAVVARIKNYVIDQLEAKYGAGCVTVASSYPGDVNAFRTYVPGSTPEDSVHNFPLMYQEEDGSFEKVGFWLKSNHPSAMQLDYVEWR